MVLKCKIQNERMDVPFNVREYHDSNLRRDEMKYDYHTTGHLH